MDLGRKTQSQAGKHTTEVELSPQARLLLQIPEAVGDFSDPREAPLLEETFFKRTITKQKQTPSCPLLAEGK